MYKPAIVTGIVMAALSVILGAFGAHGLKAMVSPEQLSIYEKGVTYQFYHSFALLATGILHGVYANRLIRAAAPLFTLGIILFSGSLYLMVALGTAGRSIGAAGIITPIGGLCFIAGWTALLLGVLKKK
jgi:uncharacterized membrane protein YgdD (TMEM256/DUF423 family)